MKSGFIKRTQNKELILKKSRTFSNTGIHVKFDSFFPGGHSFRNLAVLSAIILFMDIKRLLAWYAEEKRDLPFRHQKNSYHIWVSEIMSQQTRIEAMIPYYNRFVAKYPTLHDLANANDDELTKLWQGLGYYARVRNMKKAARICVESYDGKLPQTKNELLKLPGIGDYTAGAIASIAYNERCTAIDGNVIRVCSRYYWLEQDFNIPKNKKQLDVFLTEKLPDEKDMSDFTQALMELGARICTPKVARCQTCPLQKTCIATTKEDPCILPVAKKKLEQKVEEKKVLIVAGWKDGQWWIHLNQRDSTGLLAGMFEFDESWSRFLEIQSEKQQKTGKTEKNDPAMMPSFVREQSAPYSDGKHHNHPEDTQVEAADTHFVSVYADVPVYARYDLDRDEFVFSHKIWKMDGQLVVSDVQSGFSSLEEIASQKAIPTAYAKLFKRAVDQLNKIDIQKIKDVH